MNSIVVYSYVFIFHRRRHGNGRRSSIDFAIASRFVVFFVYSPRSSLSLFRSFVRSFHGEHDGNLHSFCWVSENVISVLLNGWKERLEERHTLIKLEKLKNVSSFFIRGGIRSNCLKRQAKIWKIAFEIIYWTIVNMHVKWYHLRFKMIDKL